MTEVNVHLEEGLRAVIDTDTHRFLAGEPVAAGGDDAGPDPYELLLAALGACVALTLRLYASRKGWDLHTADVSLRHSRVHVDDCNDCDDEERAQGGYLDQIEKTVYLEGNLDEAQRARLLEIASRCPVERTLTRGPRVVTVAG